MMRKICFLIVAIALVLEIYVIFGFTSAGRAESVFWKGFVWYSYLAAMTLLMIYGGLKLDFRMLVATSLALGFGMEVLYEVIDMTMIPGLMGDESLPPFEDIPLFLLGFGFFTISGFASMLVIYLLKRVVKLTRKRLSQVRPQT